MKTSLKLFTFKTVTNLFSRNFWSDFKKLENDATWHIELNSGHKQPFDKCSVSTFRKVKLCFNPHTSSRGFMILVQGERTWFSVITSHSCGQQSIVKIRLKSFHLWSFPKVSTFSVNVRKLCWQISNLTVFENGSISKSRRTKSILLKIQSLKIHSFSKSRRKKSRWYQNPVK